MGSPGTVKLWGPLLLQEVEASHSRRRQGKRGGLPGDSGLPPVDLPATSRDLLLILSTWSK